MGLNDQRVVTQKQVWNLSTDLLELKAMNELAFVVPFLMVVRGQETFFLIGK